MLILSRRIGETMMVGDDVTVTVLGVNGTQVRMGIHAPKEVEVHREEIYRKIHSDSPIRSVQKSDFSLSKRNTNGERTPPALG